MAKTILDLCGGTGSWSRPWALKGYDVRVITLPGYDVRTYEPPDDVWGVLAAPMDKEAEYARVKTLPLSVGAKMDGGSGNET